jgi:DNA-binding Xre family transcriptional regulator
MQRYILQDSILEPRGFARKRIMVRLRIHQIMQARHISAYALSKGTNLSYPSAYRLSRTGGVFGRMHAETLDALCGFFNLQPGRLIEWVPKGRG